MFHHKSLMNYKFKSTYGSIAVVFFLFFREFFVWYETRMLFEFIITYRTVGPALRDAGLRPHLMHVFS